MMTKVARRVPAPTRALIRALAPATLALASGFVLALLLTAALAPAQANAAARPGELILGTTTSTQDSGLLDYLLPRFEKASGLKVKVIAVGSGAAMELGRKGDADVLLVHSRAAEDQFVAEGYGTRRYDVMYNDFYLVGPANDPAGTKGKPVVDALSAIAQRRAAFISRGDKSGTHTRELELWALAGGRPGSNYLETGQGMAETLRVAAERRAYTLTDTATFQASKGLEGLRPLFENAPELENIYSVIAVNPARVPAARYGQAMAFIAFLTSPGGQKLVGGFLGRAGRPLFEPLAGVPGVDLVK